MLHPLTKTIRTYNAHHRLWQRGDTLVVAVSGGVDSMVLLDLLTHIAPKDDLQLVVAHVNHSTRGTSSDQDAQLVAKTAEVSHLPYETLTLTEALSSEDAWRTARWAFLGDVATKHNAAAIATGHHQDDQAETILLRLLRGTHLHGLSGMLPKNGMRIKPLLGTAKKDLYAYATEQGITYREDTSNADPQFLRNRVRQELLPLLKKNYNPQVVTSLANTAESLAHDYTALAALSDITPFVRGDAVHFPKKLLCEAPEAVQTLYLKHAARHLANATLTTAMLRECKKAYKSSTPKNKTVALGDLNLFVKNDTVILLHS